MHKQGLNLIIVNPIINFKHRSPVFLSDLTKRYVLTSCYVISYRLVVPPDGKWGDLQEGQWTGLVGLLQRKVICLSSCLPVCEIVFQSVCSSPCLSDSHSVCLSIHHDFLVVVSSMFLT